MASKKIYRLVRFLIFFSCFAGVVLPIGSLLVFIYANNAEMGKIIFSNMTAGMVWLKIALTGFVVGAVSLMGAAVADIIGGIYEEREKGGSK